MGESFPIEKILTMSEKRWCKMHRKSLEDYTAVGVHVLAEGGDINSFAEKVPSDAEVVVNYVPSIGGSTGFKGYYHVYSASGTALIPKEKGSGEILA